MRCELCNKSLTDVYLDGAGEEHWYCADCSDTILDTLESYDVEDDDWEWFDVEDTVDEEEDPYDEP